MPSEPGALMLSAGHVTSRHLLQPGCAWTADPVVGILRPDGSGVFADATSPVAWTAALPDPADCSQTVLSGDWIHRQSAVLPP